MCVYYFFLKKIVWEKMLFSLPFMSFSVFSQLSLFTEEEKNEIKFSETK